MGEGLQFRPAHVIPDLGSESVIAEAGGVDPWIPGSAIFLQILTDLGKSASGMTKQG